MKKSRAVINLLLILLLAAGLCYTAVFGLGADKSGSAASIKQGLDLAGGVSITYQVIGEENPSAEDMGDTIYKLQRRVETYSTEAQVYQEGSDRINIEIPGVEDANAILEELGKPGSLVFLASDGSEVLNGSDIISAQAGSQKDDMGNSQFVVQLTLNEEGTKKFAEATTKAAPTHDIIYIIYDGAIISYPSVQNAITNGSAVITGQSTYEEAENLASTIRIGGLKLELEEMRSNVVGAQLGQSAIKSSLKAGFLGFALIVVFMIAIYYFMGFTASIALVIYTTLDIMLLSAFDVTLTLPGIAGFILSIGMAVDANVIIFARIREELGKGKVVKTAVKDGFGKAFSAIFDGNITTLIAAAVLGIMGSGSIRGFALTLAIGIVVSMFTALCIAKWLINSFVALGIENPKIYGVGKKVKTIDFLGKRKIFFAVSLVFILAGFVFMGINKASTGDSLNYSLEFKGGTSTTVAFNEDMSLEQIESDVVPIFEKAIGGGGVQTQKVAGSNEVIIKTSTLNLEQRTEITEALTEKFGIEDTAITAESISSTISSEMRRDSIVAVLIATVCMLIYIWFRFKDIRFGASSVLALVHDVLVVLTFYAVVRVSVGSTFIACMLTIVGYSINATIVIFDRIRENKAEMKINDSLEQMVNESISQTLSRSIFTSLTTFIMVACLYAFGVSSIKEFALPLMAGILCGTYSSVCLTGAMWYVLRTRLGDKKTK
ncbi:MAG: protein translocase subunit SecD [Lachnospiraceae bacterium]|nr:protein translocase subunit SecD [Lachnospiraceae bacterium]